MFWNVQCGANLQAVIDPDNLITESTKSDNVYNFTVKCSPENGPDVVGSNIYFPDSYGQKKIGYKNKVTFVVRNEGDGNMPDNGSQALAMAGPSNFVKLISINPLPANKGRTYDFTYTPQDCTPLEIRLDANQRVDEINENNNVLVEPDYVTTACHSYPDLKFDWVYWKTNGYSFGKPKAGDIMNFEIDSINDRDYDYLGGCASNVYVRVLENGANPYDSFVAGSMGCGTSSKRAYTYVSYKAKCGATLTFILDPDNKNWERDESNNTWSTVIECQ